MKDLRKDPKTAPKNASYKRVVAMLTDEEGKKTKAQLEFCQESLSPTQADHRKSVLPGILMSL